MVWPGTSSLGGVIEGVPSGVRVGCCKFLWEAPVVKTGDMLAFAFVEDSSRDCGWHCERRCCSLTFAQDELDTAFYVTCIVSAAEYSGSSACVSPVSREQAFNLPAAYAFSFCFQSILAAMLAAMLAAPLFIPNRQRICVKGAENGGKSEEALCCFQSRKIEAQASSLIGAEELRQGSFNIDIAWNDVRSAVVTECPEYQIEAAAAVGTSSRRSRAARKESWKLGKASSISSKGWRVLGRSW